ncbi:MAG: tyrosine-type recombinase/integrase [Gaiellaceae bacterium]
MFSARDRKKIRSSFSTAAAARKWRADAVAALSRGGLRSPTSTTLRDAATSFVEGVPTGVIRNRKGHVYKPSVVRGYQDALVKRVLPELGDHKLAAITSGDLQALVDRLLAEGLDPSTIRNTLMPVRAIYRRACRPGGEVAVNPTRGLEIPASKGKRDRIASPAEAERLISVLEKRDQPLWATAFYAGLRLGELLALDWECVDLAAGVIHVVRSFDPVSKVFIDVKTEAGERKVPIAAVLRDYLLEHKIETGGEGLVFGRTAELPFEHSSTLARARRAWARVGRVPCRGHNVDGVPCRMTPKLGEAYCFHHRHQAQDSNTSAPPRELEPIGFHEARHTFASLMIAAGVNVKAISTFIGHRSVTTTIDRYGHLMPGSEEEAATLLDAYLERANTQARLAQVECAPVARHSTPITSGSERITADTEGGR